MKRQHLIFNTKLKLIVRSCLLFSLLLGNLSVFAETSKVIGEKTLCSSKETLKQILQPMARSTATIEILEQTELTDLGLCQNVLKTSGSLNVVYTKGDYLILGEIFNVVSQDRLNEQVIRKYQKVTQESYEYLKTLAGTILGNGQKEIVLLSDPECPYCNSFLENLTEISEELTIYYVYLPLGSHAFGQYMTYELFCTEEGKNKNQKISSIQDFLALEKEYLATFKERGEQPSEKVCEDLTSKFLSAREVLEQNGLNGAVPKIVFPDGTYHNGRMTAKDFLEKYPKQ